MVISGCASIGCLVFSRLLSRDGCRRRSGGDDRCCRVNFVAVKSNVCPAVSLDRVGTYVQIYSTYSTYYYLLPYQQREKV
jgi:hypothetical protein